MHPTAPLPKIATADWSAWGSRWTNQERHETPKPNFAALAGAAIATTATFAGILIAGAEVTDPAWWPWANLAGVPLMAFGLLTSRLLHRPVPRR